jgi:fatty acid synthase subunit alpha
MGMDLCNSSPAAYTVWEGADAHLLAVYGFSIVEMKGNLKAKYMNMAYNTMDKDSNIKTLPLCRY